MYLFLFAVSIHNLIIQYRASVESRMLEVGERKSEMHDETFKFTVPFDTLMSKWKNPAQIAVLDHLLGLSSTRKACSAGRGTSDIKGWIVEEDGEMYPPKIFADTQVCGSSHIAFTFILA